jgi:hypothetical protein
MATSPEEDQFLEEVIGLFAVEGQEWLGQINTARTKLEAGAGPGQPGQLWETLRRGLTNLGGSAATVELGSMEWLIARPAPISSPLWRLFTDGLGMLGAVLGEIAERKTAEYEALDALRRRIIETLQDPLAQKDEAAPSGSASSDRVVQVLLNLKQKPPRATASGRHVLEKVLQALQGSEGEHAGGDSAAVLRLVQKLEGQDHAFLDNVERLVPRVVQGLGELKSWSADAAVPEEEAGKVLADVRHLRETAAAVDATALTVFCAGLEGFIGVVSRHRLPIQAQRFDTVTVRLENLRRWAQQWIESGQVERAAIQEAISR